VDLTLRFLALTQEPWKEAFGKGKAYHKIVSRRQRQEEVHFPFLICHLPFSIDEPSSLKMPDEN
jgi:hypothetical protein